MAGTRRNRGAPRPEQPARPQEAAEKTAPPATEDRPRAGWVVEEVTGHVKPATGTGRARRARRAAGKAAPGSDAAQDTAGPPRRAPSADK